MARIDATRNRELLISVGRATFDREGFNAPLEGIARQAGVGIGTLYRHFPNRAELASACYANELDYLCTSAPKLLTLHEPVQALREFSRLFMEHIQLVATVLDTDPERRLIDRVAVTLQELLDACADAGELAPFSGREFLMLLGGLGLALPLKQDRQRALDLIDVVIDGLRYRA